VPAAAVFTVTVVVYSRFMVSALCCGAGTKCRCCDKTTVSADAELSVAGAGMLGYSPGPKEARHPSPVR
jgi:hypothetical protein